MFHVTTRNRMKLPNFHVVHESRDETSYMLHLLENCIQFIDSNKLLHFSKSTRATHFMPVPPIVSCKGGRSVWKKWQCSLVKPWLNNGRRSTCCSKSGMCPCPYFQVSMPEFPSTDKLRPVYIASVAYKIVSIQYWLMTIDRDYSHRSQSPNKIWLTWIKYDVTGDFKSASRLHTTGGGGKMWLAAAPKSFSKRQSATLKVVLLPLL